MSLCDASPRLGLVRGFLAETDCHAQALATHGFGAITDPNGLVSGLLTTLLGLMIAGQGWRMMSGEPLRVSAWTMSLARIGLVLALVSQWPVYRTLVFDVVYRGPQELGQALSGAWADEVGARGDPQIVLQRAYDGLLAAAPQASGDTTPAAIASQTAAAQQMRMAAQTLLISTLGPLAGARLILAALLAAGPLFVLALLFRSGVGLTEGWMRACGALGLVLLLSEVSLPIELALLMPKLQQIAANRTAQLTDAGPSDAAVTIIAVFAAIALLGLFAAGIAASALRLPRERRGIEARAERMFEPLPSNGATLAMSSSVNVSRAAGMLQRPPQADGAGSATTILRQISRATSRDRASTGPFVSAAAPMLASRRAVRPRRRSGV